MGRHVWARLQACFLGMFLPQETAKAEGCAYLLSWMPQILFLPPCPLWSGHLSPALGRSFLKNCLLQCHCPPDTLHPTLERETSFQPCLKIFPQLPLALGGDLHSLSGIFHPRQLMPGPLQLPLLPLPTRNAALTALPLNFHFFQDPD